MFGDRKLMWLGLTPEPERELPRAVAVLRAGRSAAGLERLIADERRRVERLVLHGSQRRWLRYLDEVAELAVSAAAEADPDAAALVAEVVLHHHRMLIGLPGSGYTRAAKVRALLEEAAQRP